ncbi:MAG: response regulator transcription factor [Elusimicrobia bacterium]|nr:response regulator transcription factor [Elusimicrobiota bacterium]
MEQKKKILIIDDDEAFLETFALILKEEKFDVFDATTAESGFEAVVVYKPDLIILDKNLPDKSGYEVLASIKKSKDFFSIPVMLITADTALLVDEAFDKGADDCIFKPINQQDIIKRINKILK